MKFTAIFEQGPTNAGVSVPDLPGCFAVGDTLAEAREQIASAIEFHIRCLREAGDEVPEPVSRAEDVEVAA